MYSKDYQTHLKFDHTKEEGPYNIDRILNSLHDIEIQVNGRKIVNFNTSNYLGISSNQEVLKEIHRTINTPEFGISSVHEIQNPHKNLEQKISDFLGMEDTLLYASTFDANGGVFEPLFSQENAIIFDEFNYIFNKNNIKLSNAGIYSYGNNNLNDLELQLQVANSKNYKFKIIITDGVFSMDGTIVDLKGICDLAEKYNALVMVDDSHATGLIGKTGRGTHEYNEVMGRVDIIISTLGKALGGTMGGFTSGKKKIIDLLRQRPRPYSFSNSLAPAIVKVTTKVIDVLSGNNVLAEKVMQNTTYFRKKMREIGFDIIEGNTAIVPIMVYDAKLSREFSDRLLEENIYATGFFFPVVPKGKARIRVQLTASHTQKHLDKAIEAFTKVGKELGVI